MFIFIIRATRLHKSCIFGLSNTTTSSDRPDQPSSGTAWIHKRSGPPKHAELLNTPNIPDVFFLRSCDRAS